MGVLLLITRDTKFGKSQALRIAIATWILYCLIISQAYGGSLKAYLSKPAFSNPIDTLQQVSNVPAPLTAAVSIQKLSFWA